MKNKFKYDELVRVNGKGKLYEKKFNTFAIVKCKEYDYNDYLVELLSNKKMEWFSEKELIRILERKNRKVDKYKIALAIDKRGLKIIKEKVNQKTDEKNNKLFHADFYKEYKVKNKEYAIFVWTSTHWPETNYSVECIQTTLPELRKKNIAYKQIIIGETDVTYIKINEFIDNDDNVNIFEILPKIKIKNVGGMII